MAEELPSTRNFMFFGLIMLSALVVGGAIGVAIYGFPGLPPQTKESKVPLREPDEVIEVTLQEWTIAALPVNVRRGDIVEFRVQNNGTINHNFRIDGLDGTMLLEPGAEESFVYGPAEDTSLTAWCTVLGHRDNGMEITLEIIDRPPGGEGGPPGEGPPDEGPPASNNEGGG